MHPLQLRPRTMASRWVAAALLALLTGSAPVSAAAGPAAAPAARGSAPHGLPVPGIPASLGVNFASGGNQFDPPTAAQWALLARSGFRLARTHLTWSVVQPTKAPPNFALGGYNAFVQHLKALHIRPVLELSYCNPAFPSPATPAGRAAFARFAAAAAFHFRDDGVIWEIWNEPNGGYWNCTGEAGGAPASAYAALAVATSAAIHRADPRATVIGPAASRFAMTWFAQLAADGLLPALQGFSVHGYGVNTPEEAVPEWSALHAFLAQHPVDGHALPMVSSEWGFETFDPLPAGWCCTVQVQADYLVRMMLSNMRAGTVFSVWYQFMDGAPLNAQGGQADYGVVFVNLKPKPSFQAVRVLSRTLAGQRYAPAADVAACGAGEQAMRFVQGGEAFWATGAVGKRGAFYVGAPAVTLVGQYGARTHVRSGPGGVLHVRFRRSVTYVLGAGHALAPSAPGGVRAVDSLTALLRTFFQHSVSGNLNNLGSAALTQVGPHHPVLLWSPLCGVAGYRVLSASAPDGVWHPLATVRRTVWSGSAPRGAAYLAVASVAPGGVQGPRSRPVRIAAAGASSAAGPVNR